jgi:hypothetical protein
VDGGLDQPVFAVLGGLLRRGDMLGGGGLAELLVQAGDAVAGGVELAGLGEGAGEVVLAVGGFGGELVDLGEGPGLEGFQAAEPVLQADQRL